MLGDLPANLEHPRSLNDQPMPSSPNRLEVAFHPKPDQEMRNLGIIQTPLQVGHKLLPIRLDVPERTSAWQSDLSASRNFPGP